MTVGSMIGHAGNELVGDECRRWDRRYQDEPGLFFGDVPTPFVVESLALLSGSSGNARALCLGEGEGRDALFLARSGLDVTAVDGSVVGLDKLRSRARVQGLALEVVVADLQRYAITPGYFRLIVSCYCHLEPELRRRVLRSAAQGLEPGGLLVVEGFAPDQLLNRMNSGGPKDPRVLFSAADLRADLEGFAEIDVNTEGLTKIELGRHRGLAVVTRLRARASGGAQ